MSTTAFPSRRKVAGPPPIPDTIRELAVTVYTQNKIMNAAKGIHDKKRVELLGAMDANGITDFTHAATINDVPVVLNVEIKTPNASFVDGEAAMALLFPSVAKAVKALGDEDRKKFYQTFTVTQASLKVNYGEAAIAQVLRTGLGTRNVNVKS